MLPAQGELVLLSHFIDVFLVELHGVHQVKALVKIYREQKLAAVFQIPLAVREYILRVDDMVEHIYAHHEITCAAQFVMELLRRRGKEFVRVLQVAPAQLFDEAVGQRLYGDYLRPGKKFASQLRAGAYIDDEFILERVRLVAEQPEEIIRLLHKIGALTPFVVLMEIKLSRLRENLPEQFLRGLFHFSPLSEKIWWAEPSLRDLFADKVKKHPCSCSFSGLPLFFWNNFFLCSICIKEHCFCCSKCLLATIKFIQRNNVYY